MYLLFIILWVVCLLHQSAYSILTPHRFVRLLFGKTSPKLVQPGCSTADIVWNPFKISSYLRFNFAFYCSIGFIVGMWQELALLSSVRLQQRPRSKPSFQWTLQQAPTASTKVVYSFGHSPFLTERDGKRDNGCCSLSNRDKRDVLLCPAEENISVISHPILPHEQRTL